MDGSGATEQRLADALRARAAGGGIVPASAPVTPATSRVEPPAPAAPTPATIRGQVVVALLLALLAGAMLGALVAWISVLLPGALPAFG